MQNLKRVLSLLVALAMCLSLMSVSVFAADDETEDETAAIEATVDAEESTEDEQEAAPVEAASDEDEEEAAVEEQAAEAEEESEEEAAPDAEDEALPEEDAEAEEDADADAEAEEDAEAEADEIELPGATIVAAPTGEELAAEAEAARIAAEEEAARLEAERLEAERLEAEKAASEAARLAAEKRWPKSEKTLVFDTENYTVTVTVPESAFAEAVYFRVIEMQWAELDDATRELLLASGLTEDDALLDIGFEDGDGFEVEPDVAIGVSIEAAETEIAEVYHVEDAETVAKVAEEGEAFEVDGFSLFVIKNRSGEAIMISDGETLKKAFAALNEAGGGTIKVADDVNGDIDLNEICTVSTEIALDLNGKTISGSKYLKVTAGGHLTVIDSGTNGTLSSTTISYGAIYVYGGSVTISGGTVRGPKGIYCSSQAGQKVTVAEGAAVTGTSSYGIHCCKAVLDIGENTVTGTTAPIYYLYTGTKSNGDVVYASIFSNAFAEIDSGALIKLHADSTSFTLSDATKKNVKFDLNGFKLTGITVNTGCELTILDSSANHTGNVTPTSNQAITNKGTLTIAGGTFDGNVYAVLNSGTLTINGGTFSATRYPIWNKAGGEVTITSGSIDSKSNAFESSGKTYSTMAIYNEANASLTIRGGDIGTTHAAIGVNNLSNSVTINGGAIGRTDAVYGIYNNQGNVAVHGGAITGSNDGICNSQGIVTMNDGIVTGGISVWGNGATDSATLEVSGGTITNGDSFAVAGNGTAQWAGTKITISGGTLTSTGASAIYHPQNGTLDISGGTITGHTAVYAKCGTITISGGTLIGTLDPEHPYEYYGNGCYATGDALVIDNCGYPGGEPTVNITGGTFRNTAANAVAVSSYAYNKDESTSRTPIIKFITGGVFSSNPSAYVNSDSTLSVLSLADDTYMVVAGSVTEREAVSATCETAGNIAYSAADSKYFTVDGGKYTEVEQSATVVAALGHDYAVTYTWSADNSSVTANAVCRHDATHTLTETVSATNAVTTQPTYGARGVRTYTAEFENEAFTVQTKTEEIPMLVSYDDGPSYTPPQQQNNNTLETIEDIETPLSNTDSVAVNTETTTNADGSKTTTTDYLDGSKSEVTSKTTANADGSKTTTSTGTLTDANGDKTEVTQETTTKTNSDGSTTAKTTSTETKSDGTKTETKSETVTKADGSSKATSTEVATAADGKVTTTETETVTTAAGDVKETKGVTDATGSKGTTVTENGVTTSAEATITAAAVTEAKASNEAVTLPVTVAAADSASEAATVSVTLPEATTGTTKVEVPVTEVKASTVAYVKNASGELELLKDCVVTENGIALGVEGSKVEIVIVDNAKDFNDVSSDSWANDAVQFVASREIFNGVSESSFAPQTEMSRGMLAQVLFNFDRESKATGETAFNDASGKWYDDAAGWASSLGVINGDNGKFKGDNSVSRQDLATMLYRYAEAKGYKTDGGTALSGFGDADSVDGYAAKAMQWAVGNGLIGGTDKGLEPKAGATREMVAAIMMRFCAKIK